MLVKNYNLIAKVADEINRGDTVAFIKSRHRHPIRIHEVPREFIQPIEPLSDLALLECLFCRQWHISGFSWERSHEELEELNESCRF